MTDGMSALWLVLNMALCVALLLVLRRQSALHKRNLVKLEELERSVDALIEEDAMAADPTRRPRRALRRSDPALSERATLERMLSRR